MVTPYQPLSEKDYVAAHGSGDERPAPAGRTTAERGRNLGLCAPEAIGAALPPSGNTGGKFFTPLPQTDTGDTYEVYTDIKGRQRIEAVSQPDHAAHPHAALTDWLNITFPFECTDAALHGLLSRIWTELTPKLGNLTDRNKGLHGFKRSLAFDNGGAMFAYGGQSGKSYLSLPGEACALIRDWGCAYGFCKSLGATITRWDGAVDDFTGGHSVDEAMALYLNGALGTHGKKPKMRQAGNWIEPDGSGRTLYIGKRENGKMLRVYEKGKQLGDPFSPWTRWELELHNKDRFIPLEVLLMPGQFVAGAYTGLGWIHEEASRIRTIQKTGQIGYGFLVHNARLAYGPLLNVMRQTEKSDTAILDMLVRPGKPKRLRLPDVSESRGDE